MSSTRLLGSFSNLVQSLGFTADQADALLVAAVGDTYKALSVLAAQTDGPKVAMLGSHATRTAMEPGVVRMQPGSSTDTELNLRRVLGEGQLSSKTARRIREVLQQQGAVRALLLPLVRAARGGEWLTIRNVREGSAESSGPPMVRPTKTVLDDLAVRLDKGERIIAWSLAAPPTQVLEALAKSPKPFLPNLDRAELIGAALACNACVQNGLHLETCPNMQNFVALMQPMHISWAGGPAAATCLPSILRQLEKWCDHGRVKDEVVDLDALPDGGRYAGKVGVAQLCRQAAYGRSAQFSEVVPGTMRVFPNAKAAADALQVSAQSISHMIAISPRTYCTKGADGNVYRAWRAN